MAQIGTKTTPTNVAFIDENGVTYGIPQSSGYPEFISINSLVPSVYDYLALTYVAAGNGVGEVETVTYKTGGSGGTTVATLTLTYNASNEVATVTRS